VPPAGCSCWWWLGGFSGLGALDRSGASFVTVTDRGPNQDIKVRGDKGSVFLLPDYTPSILRLAIDQGQLRMIERLPLRLPRGRDRVTGEREISGLPSSGRDEPAFDADRHKTLGVDPNGVDTEGIAVDPPRFPIQTPYSKARGSLIVGVLLALFTERLAGDRVARPAVQPPAGLGDPGCVRLRPSL
jgi:hypothetical protein